MESSVVHDACGTTDEVIVGGDVPLRECDSDKGQGRGLNEVSMNEVCMGEPAVTAGRGLKDELLTIEFLPLAVPF